MYVILELQAAVDVKPGSYVKRPVFLYKDEIFITSGPIEPLRPSNSYSFPVLVSTNLNLFSSIIYI